MPEKCPECGSVNHKVPPSEYHVHCRDCGGRIKCNLINPAELLALIEEAKKRPNAELMKGVHITSWYGEVLEAVQHYLKGHPDALRELAGEKEES